MANNRIFPANKKEILSAVENTTKKASKVLLKYFGEIKSSEIISKKSQGLVSKADKESERVIKSSLVKAFPQIDFLGEEEYFELQGDKKSNFDKYKNQEYCWIVDPLDGTTNYLSGLDLFVICIGLVHRGRPIFGAIYRPTSDEFYYAFKNHGTFKKNLMTDKRAKRLKLSSSKLKLRESLLVTGFTSEKGKIFDQEFELFKKMMAKSRGIRRLGSAALDVCLVVEGVFGGFWESGLAPWDITAPAMILEEAGGFVGDYSGREFCPFQSTTLMCHQSLKRRMIKEIAQA